MQHDTKDSDWMRLKKRQLTLAILGSKIAFAPGAQLLDETKEDEMLTLIKTVTGVSLVTRGRSRVSVTATARFAPVAAVHLCSVTP